MEHLSTFGLTRDPFANEPRLEGWFGSPAHQGAERRLARGVRQGKGLALLLGEGGTGKTLLARRILESLEDEMFEACMLVPVPAVSDVIWVLDRFARQLGVDEPAAEPSAVLGQIYEQLAVVREDGRHTVLVVDEALVLADTGALAALRGLLNLEYEDRRLLTVVLVGAPELADAVATRAGLGDRVELRVSLDAMDAQSSADYLRHRIREASGNPAILESAAVDALVKLGDGTPRRLNNLADAALFEAHLCGRPAATAEDVARAAAELGVEARSGARGAARELSGAPEPATADLSDADALEEPTVLEPPIAPLRPARPARSVQPMAPTPAADEVPPPVADAGQTVAMLSDDDEDDDAPIVTPTPAREPAPPAGRRDAGQTVALFVDAEPEDADGADETDGELDDLFADLVED